MTSRAGKTLRQRRAGRRAVVAQLDTTDLTEAGDVIEGMIDDLGGCDVFVNNSGTGDNKPLLELLKRRGGTPWQPIWTVLSCAYSGSPNGWSAPVAAVGSSP